MNDQITYSERSDILTVRIDELPDDMMDIHTSQPFELVLDMVFNKYTGALLEFDITGLKSSFDEEPPEGLEYDPDSDTLYLHLHPDDSNDAMCDMAYVDPEKNVLITLNRSKVGNLTGIEIVGLEALLETTIDIRKN